MHFAAFINNEESINNPEKYFINNYHNGKLFFKFVLRIILKKVIYSSTAAVYGNKKKG